MARMLPRFTQHRWMVSVLLVAVVVVPSLGVLLLHSGRSVAYARAQAVGGTPSVTTSYSNPLPDPSWWSGTCNTNNYASSTSNPGHIAASPLHLKDGSLASYRGVLACGPRPIADNGPDVPVTFPGGNVQLEWECVELVMRYMYLAYDINAYPANGNQVVSNYTTYNSNPILQPVPNDGSSQTDPQPGDILSYNSSVAGGHTSLVIKNNVDSSGTKAGNGTITVLEQNFSGTGEATLPVGINAKLPAWEIGKGVTGWLHHTVDISPQSAPAGTVVTIQASGFQPGESVAIKLDGSQQKGTPKASSTGSVSTHLTVPSSEGFGSHTVELLGLKSGFDPTTVLYVQPWSQVASLDLGSGDNSLDGVAALASNNVWAVGHYFDAALNVQQTLIENYDGSGWNYVLSPDVGTDDSRLFAVSGTSASDVWAVGDYFGSSYQTLIEHYDGMSWSTVLSPDCASYPNDILSGVTAISATDAWAVGSCFDNSGNGSALALHWNGSVWSPVSTPTFTAVAQPGFTAVAAISSTDVWAVGTYGTSTLSVATLMEHWNGSSWTVFSSPNVGTNENYVTGVAAVSSKNVWTVGYENSCGNPSTCPPQTLIEYWNGKKWAVVTSPDVTNDENYLVGVAATPSGDLWAVGDSYSDATTQSAPLAEHWDGTRWSLAPTANIGVPNSWFNAVSAVSASDVWAVGGSEASSSAPNQTLTEQYS